MNNKTHPQALDALLDARHHDPFRYLGLHSLHGGWILRLFLPYAQRVEVFDHHGAWQPALKVHDQGFFEWRGESEPPRPCRIRYLEDGHTVEGYDPYSFAPLLSDLELHLFNEGRLLEIYRTLGACVTEVEGVAGTRFSVWAPNAERVSVVGTFNRWDGRQHPMRSRGSSGVWEIFIPGVAPGALYKYEIRAQQGAILTKTDPCGLAFEYRPGTATVVTAPSAHGWNDQDWMTARAGWDWLHQPFNVYEVHLGSWRRPDSGTFHDFPTLAVQLIPYVKEMGYTHIELMPISEHPLDESWGYQTTGYFGITSRYGTPDQFRAFVDACHQDGIGVLIDWVPGHFPKDDFALARFDGTALYEHADPRLGEHQDWGTYIFNYGRSEVRSFLLSNAHYWLDEFHIDGLRVDAVASMLYLDYSRQAGEWIPNRYGGRENIEALTFLRDTNWMVHEKFPGALTIAEESTSWPMVSRPIYLGGLGFSMKWNMGWMNDTLRYFSRDPIYRRHHHSDLTFGLLYAFTENFLLPFSHDEVVHGKKSLLDKMPGDDWQRFANLRLLFLYQMGFPGKKLNFMGNEFGHGREWEVNGVLDWSLLGVHWHRGLQLFSRDINQLYLNNKALYEIDFEPDGFYWIDCNDANQSVLSFVRRSRSGQVLVVVLNFTPLPRIGYRIGVPGGGRWQELINSDSGHYGGSNCGNGGEIVADGQPWNGQPVSLTLTLPPLGGLILEHRA